MDEHTRQTLEYELSLMDPEALSAMTRRYEWLATSRPDQLPPDPADPDWLVWMLMAGRGAGKTRSGAEDIWWSGYMAPERIALVGPTSNDVRKTIFEGESGLLARIPSELIVNYNRTNLELWTRTASGEQTYYVGYSAEEPERFRGPQHHRAWADELGAWGRKAEDTWDMMMFGLRLGSAPRVLVTTTPRTTTLVRRILADRRTRVSTASTFDNIHLPLSILQTYRERYEGTRLGRQELYAQLLTDVVGALWKEESFRRAAPDWSPRDESFRRVVVAVDPSGSASDSIGIVVAAQTENGDYAVLADLTCSGSPSQWGRVAVDAYYDFGADRLVAETNYGGAMVEATIRNVDENVSFRAVTASRGKVVRAEPISALYEQDRVIHARGLDLLENQMCQMTLTGYQGDGSPDRVDALVWALSELSGRSTKREKTLAADGERADDDGRRPV